MRGICNTKTLVCLLSVGLCCLLAGGARAADEQPSEDLIQMVVDLVTGDDPDMRTLGLQQVRDEMPGAAVTKRFTELLPKLLPEVQAGLLDALGDRRDAVARPAVLAMLESRQQQVRAAALRALGTLGNVAEVPLLTRNAAAGSVPERAAARKSLVQLRGDGVNAAMVAVIAKGEPNVRVELLGVLAARNATETIGTVLKSAKDADATVRLAAIGALRILAEGKHAAAIVDILKASKGDAQRAKAELALLVVCSKGRESCAGELIAGLAEADVPSRVALLRALARAGGPKALQSVLAHLKDEDQAVRDQAVRMLSLWRDPAVAPRLLAIARSAENPRHQVLAIRGLVRLASPQKNKPADLKTLAEVMSLAKRPQEKRLVLGALGDIPTPESLELVAPALDDPALAEEAALAAVMIAEKIKGGDKDKIRPTMEKVLQRAKDRKVQDRARKVLESL